MNTPNRNTTIRPKTKAILPGLLLAATVVFAHGGLEHIRGTVKNISGTSVTVATTAGKSVEIVLNAKTAYTRADKPAQVTDLKVGDRVVIHAEEKGTTLTAQTVEIGTAPAKKAAAQPVKGSAAQH